MNHTLVFGILLAVTTPFVVAIGAHIGQDASGNLHVNASHGQTVFVNGVNFTALLGDVKNLRTTLGSFIPQRLIILWGHDRAYRSAKMIHFDGTTWSSVRMPISSRYGHIPIVFRGSLYIISGFWEVSDGLLYSKNPDFLDYVEVFDGSSWTFGPRMPIQIPRMRASACVYNNTLFVIGGFNGSITTTASVLQFNGTLWSNAPSTLQSRGRVGSAVYQGFMFLVGGATEETAPSLRTVEKYDGRAWSYAPSLQTARRDHAVAVFNNTLYACGGYDRTVSTEWYVTSVEIFNGIAWSYGPELKTGQKTARLAVFGNVLYLFRSTSFADPPTTLVERLQNNTWVQISMLPLSLDYLEVAVY